MRGWYKLARQMNLDLIFGVVPAVLQAILAGILIKRKLYSRQRLPFFFAYSIYSISATILRHSVVSRGQVFFHFYWSTEAVYKLLALLVLWEIFQRAFAQEYEDHRFRLVLPGIMVFVALLCVWEAVRHPLARPVPLPESIIYWSDLGVHGVEAIICSLYLMLRRPLAAPENRYEFGILVGFGISACISIVAFLALFEFGTQSVNFFRYGPPMGYLLATIIWLAAFWKPPEPQPKPGSQTLRNLADYVSRAANEAKRDSGKRLFVGSRAPFEMTHHRKQIAVCYTYFFRLHSTQYACSFRKNMSGISPGR